MVVDPGIAKWEQNHAEHEPIRGASWLEPRVAECLVGVRGQSPLKLKVFCRFLYKRGTSSWKFKRKNPYAMGIQ